MVWGLAATLAIVVFGEAIAASAHATVAGMLIIASPLALNGAFAYLILRRFEALSPGPRGRDSARGTGRAR